MTPRAEQRRGQIVATALELFARQGYHATGVADIAAELRMSHGTFYRYFESKRAILDAVVESLALRIRQAIELGAVAQDACTPDEYQRHLRETARALLTILADDPRSARVLLFEAAAVDDAMRARLFELFDEIRAAATEYLRHGLAAGYLRADLDIHGTARSINGLIYAGALAAVRSGEFPAGYVDAAVELLLCGISEPRPASAPRS